MISRLILALFAALLFAGPVLAQGAPTRAPAVKALEGSKLEPEAIGTVDLNIATAEQLTTLKGIGLKKAEAIIAWRNANGGFKSVDDLTQVKGIGQKTLEKLRARLTVAGADGSVMPAEGAASPAKGAASPIKGAGKPTAKGAEKGIILRAE